MDDFIRLEATSNIVLASIVCVCVCLRLCVRGRTNRVRPLCHLGQNRMIHLWMGLEMCVCVQQIYVNALAECMGNHTHRVGGGTVCTSDEME